MSKRRIGVLMAGDKSYPAYSAFREELGLKSRMAGLTVETFERFAEGRHERLPSLAAELAAYTPDVIVAIGAVSFYAIRAVVGSSVPVVFAIVIDPFAAGIVTPGSDRNDTVTGATSFNADQTFRQISLLNETLGVISTLAVIGDADVPPLLAGTAETAARALGMRLVIRLLRSPDEIDRVMNDFRDDGATGLLGLEVPRVNTHCLRIAEAATAVGLPTVFAWEMARASPLLAYGTSLSGATRRAAAQAVRIARGERPAMMPVEYETDMYLAVNLVTARRLAVKVPKSVIDAAGQVIA